MCRISEDRVVVDGLAGDGSAVARETRFDVALELDDPAAQVGVDLVRRVALLQDLDLTGHDRVEPGLRTCGADRGERVGIGERVGERDVGGRAPLLGLGPRVDVGVPPRAVHRGLQRFQRRAARGDDVGGGHLNQMRW